MNFGRSSVKNICNFDVSKSVFSFLFIIVFMAASVSALSVSTDKADYSPEQTVIVTGAGFDAGAQLMVRVTRPDGSIVTGDGSFAAWPTAYDDVVADANGAFVYNYILDGILGEYTIDVLGSNRNVLTSTTFTDGDILYDQCSNDLGTGYSSGDTGCRWTNGNLQSNNAIYYEGDATVQRLSLTGFVPGSVHTVTLKYGTTKDGSHAYDFLTAWDWSENWVTVADRCQRPLHRVMFSSGGLTTKP